jgi:Fe2+ transport system protein FeoA
MKVRLKFQSAPADIRVEKERREMTLSNLKPGQVGEVTEVRAHGAIRQRLLDMGILPGAIVKVERLAPNGDPVWIRLQGSQLALRRHEAESVGIVRS